MPRKLSQRQQQLIVSSIGTLLIIPLDLFLGVMFTFAFTSHESALPWGFDFVSFWCQIIGILASFFKPRLAGWWMLVCIAVSIFVAVGFEVDTAYAPDAVHLNAAQWLKDAPWMLRTVGFFWGLPLAFALLLLRTSPSGRTAGKQFS